MNLKSFSIVCIRLMAVYFLVLTLGQVVRSLPTYYMTLARVEFGEWAISGALFLLGASAPLLLIWFLARPLSALVTSGVEDESKNASFTLKSFECLALRLLGFYLLAVSLPSFIASCFVSEQIAGYVYSQGLQALFGLLLILFAHKLASYLDDSSVDRLE